MAAPNPYASQLGNFDPLEVIRATPHTLIHLADGLGAGGFERSYAPGKWTARMILSHLADTEIAFAFRLRQAIAEENHLIQPFDQDAWAAPYSNPAFHAQTALQVFAALRGWNVVFLESLAPETQSRPVSVIRNAVR